MAPSPRSMHNLIPIIIFFCTSLLIATANADYLNCPSDTNFTRGGAFQANLDALLSSLPATAAAASGFSKISKGAKPDQAYGLALCRGDATASTCRACLDALVRDLATRCPGQKSAILIYGDEPCLLRHSDASIGAYTRPELLISDPLDATQPERFGQLLGALMGNLTEKAAYASPRRFAVGTADVEQFVTLYGMLQCTPDLAGDDCNSCLVNAVSNIPVCCDGKKGGRVFSPSCSIRFEVFPFYNAQAAEAAMSLPPPAGGRVNASTVDKKSRLLKILLPIIAFMLLLTCIALIWTYKYRGKWQEKENQNKLMRRYFSISDELKGENTECPFVSYEDILSATNFFADSNLLGQGGFGKVYKGILEGGYEVAVKRLSKGSGQGIVEFKNEVVLIAKLQHKNLVRLLGCCIQEDEQLLIYEYLPNKSLDAFIFDDARKHMLDWSTRFKIIKGIARGLLYLHQDSRLTIIHRDLKASNILLDAEMTPKISDFGMARIFGANQNHANTTRVVGTYGYMSPEYAMGGAFSVKTDTYSFGVLLLEIVSGLKISSPQLKTNFCSLITYAWRIWEDGEASELVDSSILASCPFHEVLRCIHVGLLCVQDHPNDRPLISSVMRILENENTPLPTPKQPVYFPLSNCEGGEARENIENSVNAISITTLEGR